MHMNFVTNSCTSHILFQLLSIDWNGLTPKFKSLVGTLRKTHQTLHTLLENHRGLITWIPFNRQSSMTLINNCICLLKDQLLNMSNSISWTKKLEGNELELISFEKSNVAKRYLNIVNLKFGSELYRKIFRNLSSGTYSRLPGGSLAIPKYLSTVNNSNAVLDLLSDI